MKKKLLLTTGLSALVATSVYVGAFAASNLQEIQAYLNMGIKFKLNGKAWQAQDEAGNVINPITYNGTTYLPARAVGEAFGVKVGWDAENNTVLLGENGTTETIVKGSSRSNPAVKGDLLTFKVKNFADDYEGTLKVHEVIRGEQAGKMLKEANQFNEEAKESSEYILAKIEVKITKNAKDGAQVSINNALFDAVSGEGRDYEHVFAVTPSPEISTKLYTNASHTGWAVFQVDKADKNPVLTFARNYDGTGGVWVKLQ
ncbi:MULTISPECIES: copper amine oxidase N-terminal domain-containing protein [Paenibacillus]|uniref:Copper amine oxidase N-terminal domain-containing protein n=1 Tax=Paenibacillus validus TaxID=44253 RepID=A0A7X2Z9R6_9BACL|nr:MULTISPECIES: copper amine oxidase N-terminal domain-containing protein [Paenibacillus]MUG70964.1 hypothetical protein [Paenibacillus validus]